MNLVKRLKRLWSLAKKDKDTLEEFLKLSDKEIMNLPDENEKVEFIGMGTNDEYKDFQDEQKGLKGIFGIKR